MRFKVFATGAAVALVLCAVAEVTTAAASSGAGGGHHAPRHHKSSKPPSGSRTFKSYSVATTQGFSGRFIVSHGHVAAFMSWVTETCPDGSQDTAVVSAGGFGANLDKNLAPIDKSGNFSFSYTRPGANGPSSAKVTGHISGSSASGTIDATDVQTVGQYGQYSTTTCTGSATYKASSGGSHGGGGGR